MGLLLAELARADMTASGGLEEVCSTAAGGLEVCSDAGLDTGC